MEVIRNPSSLFQQDFSQAIEHKEQQDNTTPATFVAISDSALKYIRNKNIRNL